MRLPTSLGKLSFILTALLVVVIACGGGGSGTSDVSEDTSPQTPPGEGRAVKGPVANATVTMYALNADGSRGGVLQATTSDSEGKFRFRSYQAGPLEIVVTGGSYVDEATGATVDMTGREMTTVIATSVGRGESIAVTPLTSAAATQTRARVANGEDITAAIATSNANVADQFGLTGVDITKVLPTDLTDPTESSIPGEQSTDYAAAIAALSQNAKDGGMTPDEVLDLADNIGEDLSDGVLDDKAGNAPLTHNLPVTSSQTVNDIEQKADEFLAGPQNQSGVTPGQVTLKPTITPTPTPTPTSNPTTNPTPTPVPADVTPPTTTATLAEQGKTATTWTGNATINEAGTGYITALATGSAAPTAAEIVADNNANKVGTGCNVTLTANASGACAVSGLTSLTTYDFYFVAKDTSNNFQTDATALASKVTATTLDGTPPTTTGALAQSANNPFSWSGTATINENGTGYCAALPNGAAAPTPSQIKAGAGGGIVGTRGMIAMTANVQATCTVTALTDQTAYDFYFTAEDAVPNLQGGVSGPVTATTPDGTPPTTDVAFSQNALTNTTWTGQASLNEAGTGYLTALTAGSAPPTAAEIAANTNANKAGSGCTVAMPTPATTYTCQITGLVEGGAYDFYFVAKDTANNFQSDGTAAGQKVAGVTTPDATPPTVDVAFATQSNTAGTSWTGSASLNEAGTGYCTALVNGSGAPTAAEIKANNNANKVGTGGSVAMGTPATTYTCTVTGLSSETTYDFYFAAEDTATNLQANGTVATQKVTVATPDITPPTTDVAWAQQSNTLGTSWTGQASLNEAGTGYCVAVPNGGAAPTSPQVKAGTGGAIVGTGGTVAMGTPATTYNCAVTGLTESTAYDFYFVAQDTATNLQAAPSSAVSATTPDVTPPTVDVAWSQQSNTAGTSWTGQASLNEAGTGYCVAVPNGGAAPTAAQTKAGAGGAIVGTGGTVAMGTPATTYNCSVTGLSQMTSYDFYFVAEDAATNLMAAATGPVSATTPDVTPPTVDVAWSQQSNTAGTSWTGQASLNEAGTGYCTAITNGSAAPSSAEVKANNNVNKVGTGATVAMATPATTYNCTVTGLSSETAYDFYFVGQDTAGPPNLMAAPSGPVTATTPDITPPTITAAFADNAGTASATTTWDGTATINENGTGYCTAITNGSGAPTAAEVKANNNANKVGTGGSVAMTANTQAVCQVTGLTVGTTYDFYFAAQDTATNLQTTVSGPVTVSTLADPCGGQTSNVATGTGLPLGVPDLGNASVTFNVTKPDASCTVADVNITFNVSTTVGSDLTFELTDPNPTTVMLIANNPSGPWADSNNGFPGITLDDAAANLIPDCFTSPNGTGCVAGDMVSGTYRPHNALSGFNTHAGNGTWTLKITDKLGTNTGTINSASILVTWQ